MADADLTRTGQLANHLCNPVAKDVQTKARLHLLDWLGCVAGARRSEVAGVAIAAEPDVLARAALLGNVLEMDDVHRAAVLHPGPVVWPAALSAARDEKAGMARLLDGAVRGYEAVIVVGDNAMPIICQRTTVRPQGLRSLPPSSITASINRIQGHA